MNSRAYRKPLVYKVDLRPEEAVLNSCKFVGEIIAGHFQSKCWTPQGGGGAISCYTTGS